MTEPTGSPDRLVEDYLGEVARACAGLPALQRMELMDDLREHIAVARADLPAQTEAGVRGILGRLGEPAVIAAEARASAPPVAIRVMPTPMPVRGPSRTPAPVVALMVLVPVAVIAVMVVLGGLFTLWRP
ncbi:MAG TPA: hypothetical protein VFC19_34375 [Candidatus Limnocylindrales bacterium]|nr:hypothetical protein [Candidatus Limnocylindrales bacterium]